MKVFSHSLRYRRAERNYRANSRAADPGALINGQAVTDGVSGMRYGRFTMGYNGCEIIAVCNALRLLGIPAPLAEIAREAEECGYTWLAGLFGTRPRAVGRHLERRGLIVRRAKSLTEAEKLAESEKVLVLVFWNSRRNPFRGIHTVAAAAGAGGLTAYNMFSNSSSLHAFRTVGELVGHGRLICCYAVSTGDQ